MAVSLMLSSAAPAAAGDPPDPEDRRVEVHLKMEAVTDDPEQLACRFTARQIELLEKLNRADREHLPQLGELVVPDQWDLDEVVYSPLPAAWTAASNVPKALVLSQLYQVFGAYERGALVRWGPVSSGRQSQPTPSGLFYLNWKSPGRRSTVNSNWFLPWYFNFINERGISFHQFELPGRPASHGCVRLLKRDARWVYDWGDQWRLDARGWFVEEEGTPVLILGQCDYSQKPPWRSADYLAAQRPVVLNSITVPGAVLAKLRRDEESMPQPIPADGAAALAGSEPEHSTVTDSTPLSKRSGGS